MGPEIRVLVIDDASLLRDGVCALLALESDLRIVGATETSAEAIRVAEVDEPHVALLDVSVATRAGLEAVVACRRRWPAVHLIMLTWHEDSHLIDAALHAGIEGYVLKSDPSVHLLAAIRSAAESKRYLTPSIVRQVVSGYVVRNQVPQPRRTGLGSLSEREREVMRLITTGLRTREIAGQLSLSHKTIEKHRSNLMRKLGLRSSTAVAAYAIAHGYVAI